MLPVNDDKHEQRGKFEFWRCWNALYAAISTSDVVVVSTSDVVT